MNHCPFDFGRLYDLSVITQQKSVKSICGHRIAISAANPHKHVDCLACRQQLNDKREFDIELLSTTTGETKELLSEAIAEIDAILNQ